jgi:carbon-monoxide dehydrogenase small subunit
MSKSLLVMKLNGESVKLSVASSTMLVDVLRNELGLTGTKEACGKGECGACTVLLDGKAVTSCITPAMKVMNREVLTIEGLGGAGRIHPVQQAFIECGAVQCGFCSPGMILSAKALLDNNSNPSEEEVRVALSGNLCRCTGYVKIVEAVLHAAEEMRKTS